MDQSAIFAEIQTRIALIEAQLYGIHLPQVKHGSQGHRAPVDNYYTTQCVSVEALRYYNANGAGQTRSLDQALEMMGTPI